MLDYKILRYDRYDRYDLGKRTPTPRRRIDEWRNSAACVDSGLYFSLLVGQDSLQHAFDLVGSRIPVA